LVTIYRDRSQRQRKDKFIVVENPVDLIDVMGGSESVHPFGTQQRVLSPAQQAETQMSNRIVVLTALSGATMNSRRHTE
jgi:hypothetical protein